MFGFKAISKNLSFDNKFHNIKIDRIVRTAFCSTAVRMVLQNNIYGEPGYHWKKQEYKQTFIKKQIFMAQTAHYH